MFIIKNKDSIQQRIQGYLDQEKINMYQFSQRTGINRGILSRVMNQYPPKLLSLHQYDQITKVFHLPEGTLYSLYREECFRKQGNWRRLRPFLMRCAQLKRFDDIVQLMKDLSEHLHHIPEIFLTAEQMIQEGYDQAALFLYECVIESEKDHLSERLAISHYRILKIQQYNKQNIEKIAIRFVSYRTRLPEAYALDGLLLLIKIYFAQSKWNETMNYIEELFELTQAMYNNPYSDETNLLRPLVYYYGMSFLWKNAVYDSQNLFEEAQGCISHYQDLSWFEGLNQEGQKVVIDFQNFAYANSLSLHIKLGNSTSIAEYIKYLKQNPNEIIEGLNTLLESSNQYSWDIQEWVYEFKSEIEQFQHISINMKSLNDEKSGLIQDIHRYRSYSIFFYKFGIYCMRHQNIREGISYILQSLELCLVLDDKEGILSGLSCIEPHRFFLNENQEIQLKKLSEEVKKNEKNNGYMGFVPSFG